MLKSEEMPSGQYLDQKGTGNLSTVRDEFQDATTPEPPLDTVVHSQGQASSLSAILLPPLLLALSSVPANGPPHALETWADFTILETSVVFCSSYLTCFERLCDLLGYNRSGSAILELVQIGSFEGTGVSESHERGDPPKRHDVPPSCSDLGDLLGVVERLFCRRDFFRSEGRPPVPTKGYVSVGSAPTIPEGGNLGTDHLDFSAGWRVSCELSESCAIRAEDECRGSPRLTPSHGMAYNADGCAQLSGPAAYVGVGTRGGWEAVRGEPGGRCAAHGPRYPPPAEAVMLAEFAAG